MLEEYCYELNWAPPPNSHIAALNLMWSYLEIGVFGRWPGLHGLMRVGLLKKLVPFKETPMSLLTICPAMWGLSKKAAFCKPQRDSHQEPDHAGALTLVFWPPEPWELNVCCVGHHAHGILLLLPPQTKIKSVLIYHPPYPFLPYVPLFPVIGNIHTYNSMFQSSFLSWLSLNFWPTLNSEIGQEPTRCLMYEAKPCTTPCPPVKHLPLVSLGAAGGAAHISWDAGFREQSKWNTAVLASAPLGKGKINVCQMEKDKINSERNFIFNLLREHYKEERVKIIIIYWCI